MPSHFAASGDVLKINKTILKWFVFYPQLCREDHKARHIYFNEQQQQQTATTKTIPMRYE